VRPVSYTARPALPSGGRLAKPRAVITAFPGTNCEFDTARAVADAGGVPEIALVRNLTAADLEQSVLDVEAAIKNSQIIIIPGGFSGGDEPDGSAKFITAFFRNPPSRTPSMSCFNIRDGLMLGIFNVPGAREARSPFGEIRPMDDTCPTLTYNLIARHQSRYVLTRVASVAPRVSLSQVGDVHNLPDSHGEGRCRVGHLLKKARGQRPNATQYCDPAGNVSTDNGINRTAPLWRSRHHGPEAGFSGKCATANGAALLPLKTSPGTSISQYLKAA
jgi:phosphoribosylformylglycinamidine synthase